MHPYTAHFWFVYVIIQCTYMAESQKVEQCELPHSSSLLDDVFTEESPRTKLLSNASSSRGSMSSVSEQQDDGKRRHLFVCVCLTCSS